MKKKCEKITQNCFTTNKLFNVSVKTKFELQSFNTVIEPNVNPR